jgi:uncharacterized protein (DUF1697 family)
MVIHMALLRGVNVGGQLRALLGELGFAGARSLLQSGNLVFRSDARTGADLEILLERESAKRLDLRTDFLVRTAEEWGAVVARNPFRDEAERDPGHLVVMFLKGAPSAKAVETLNGAMTGPEIIRADVRQAYIVYPNGIGRSRLTGTPYPKQAWNPWHSSQLEYHPEARRPRQRLIRVKPTLTRSIDPARLRVAERGAGVGQPAQ